MRIDYRKLGQIAIDPSYRNIPAKDTSDVLANYLYLMSNLNADVDAWSASEMAMITNSLNRWHLFHREWATHQNLAGAYHELQEKFVKDE